MTFSQLFSAFQDKYGKNHDFIFFELLFYCSQTKTKEQFIVNHNNNIDFKEKVFWRLCNDYFVKEKPLAHITSQTTFCGLTFKVSKKVLAPRELTQQMVMDFVAIHEKDVQSNVLDLCCGCGCIGISIKKFIPQFNITCVDKYWQPILDTYKNAAKNKTPLTIDCKDAFKYLDQHSHFDYIISNPPYINEENFNNNKMFRWENKKALIAPENGLYFYKRFFEWLSTHNFIEAWFEIGYDLVEPIKQEILHYSNLVITFPKQWKYRCNWNSMS